MSIQFHCPTCQTRHLVSNAAAGRSGPCPACGATLTLPTLDRCIPDPESVGDYRVTEEAFRASLEGIETLAEGREPPATQILGSRATPPQATATQPITVAPGQFEDAAPTVRAINGLGAPPELPSAARRHPPARAGREPGGAPSVQHANVLRQMAYGASPKSSDETPGRKFGWLALSTLTLCLIGLVGAGIYGVFQLGHLIKNPESGGPRAHRMTEAEYLWRQGDRAGSIRQLRQLANVKSLQADGTGVAEILQIIARAEHHPDQDPFAPQPRKQSAPAVELKARSTPAATPLPTPTIDLDSPYFILDYAAKTEDSALVILNVDPHPLRFPLISGTQKGLSASWAEIEVRIALMPWPVRDSRAWKIIEPLVVIYDGKRVPEYRPESR